MVPFANGGTTWLTAGEDLPNVPVTDLEYRAASTSLYAATFGRGTCAAVDAYIYTYTYTYAWHSYSYPHTHLQQPQPQHRLQVAHPTGAPVPGLPLRSARLPATALAASPTAPPFMSLAAGPGPEDT